MGLRKNDKIEEGKTRRKENREIKEWTNEKVYRQDRKCDKKKLMGQKSFHSRFVNDDIDR